MKYTNNCWARTKVASLKADGKMLLELFYRQSLLRLFFGRSFTHPFNGKCTTLCQPLDRGFESSLFQNMDVPSLRAIVLALPSLSFFCHILLPLFSSRPRFDYFNALLSLLSPAPRLPSRLNREANFQLFSNMKFHEP